MIYSCFLCVFQQVEKVIKHRELEQKLADAKLEQATAILMEEKGKNQKEKELVSEGDVESGLRFGASLILYLVESGKIEFVSFHCLFLTSKQETVRQEKP